MRVKAFRITPFETFDMFDSLSIPVRTFFRRILVNVAIICFCLLSEYYKTLSKYSSIRKIEVCEIDNDFYSASLKIGRYIYTQLFNSSLENSHPPK